MSIAAYTSHCPVCCGLSIRVAQHVANLPLLLFPVKESVRNEIETRAITSFQCDDCSHVFTAPLDVEAQRLIYEEYYAYYPYDNLETMLPVYRQPFLALFEKTIAQKTRETDGNRLLEIGCASANQLEVFSNYNLDAFGVDPSKRAGSMCPQMYYGNYEALSFESTFDIIVARFVVEHVNDLNEFLTKVRSDLSDDGLFFVQVPNIAEFALAGMPFFLAHEHIHYFNVEPLYRVMHRHGFEVVAIEHQ